MIILTVLFYILLFIFISLVLRIIYTKCNKTKKKIYDLKKDGIMIIPKLLTDIEKYNIKNLVLNGYSLEAKKIIMNSQSVRHKIESILGVNYGFHDYIFVIKKSQFNVCHRDYNGKSFNSKQLYPSYTIIIYFKNMDKSLDIIPGSHKSLMTNAINITDYSDNIVCPKGGALLFDANLIHSGSINKNELNLRIQMKISHKNDKNSTLNFFQKYNKELNKEGNRPLWFKKLSKHLSCTMPIISQFTQAYEKNNNIDNSKSNFIYPKLDNI
jgi:ectoine hydroxylase-related dioxygenase (phytanoyl-CoA dioxygenase family)